MRLEGQTYQAIGTALGISRQRAQQLIRAPKAIRNMIARQALWTCEGCGTPTPSGDIHHKLCVGTQADTFNDPENLQYLCDTCHRRAHARKS